MEFQSGSPGAFITGFPMATMGSVWIFSGIAHCSCIMLVYLCSIVVLCGAVSAPDG